MPSALPFRQTRKTGSGTRLAQRGCSSRLIPSAVFVNNVERCFRSTAEATETGLGDDIPDALFPGLGTSAQATSCDREQGVHSSVEKE
jgi:hypothetical protein